LHLRNMPALQEMGADERHQAENEDLMERFGRLFANPQIPLADRVRMACSLGAVIAGLIDSRHVFGEVAPEELTELVRASVKEMFATSATPGAR
ncbi:MAG TPA: hypothetical protein VMA96_01520, partial [Solirubrobacteraceae bacterium]|nr:hypothetical protein [Solirubrobacteraceae bacterium]